MDIAEAQRDVRTVFMGGFPGQLVSGLIWLLSVIVATWHSVIGAIAVLVIGGMFIFPLTQLVLRLMGRQTALDKGHPMNKLAVQVAFTLPCMLPLVAAATACQLGWFYPAFMIAVGAHYLPFMFLYGMWYFGLLAGLLLVPGAVLVFYGPPSFTIGGWWTAAVLLVFAFVGRRSLMRER